MSAQQLDTVEGSVVAHGKPPDPYRPRVRNLLGGVGVGNRLPSLPCLLPRDSKKGHFSFQEKMSNPNKNPVSTTAKAPATSGDPQPRIAKAAALTVERLPLSKLAPHPRNPRRHPEPGTPAWNVLKKSIQHDYFDPIIWNKRNGMLVSGHLRRKVLEASGFTEADCVVVDYDEPTHLARLIAANKLQGEDDGELLRDLLVDLKETDLDLDLSGIHADELEGLLKGGGGNEPANDEPPADFPEKDENIETTHNCPKCGYKWSGNAA